jgi:hypothetical protein
VVADDRSGPLAGLSSSPSSSLRAGGLQSATFEVGALLLELSASPGAARLVIAGDRVRDTYVVEPTALAAWAVATTRLLSLEPADSARGRVAIRTPFLIDREGRPSVAFEARVSEEAVEFRLLVTNVPEQGGDGFMTTEDVVRGMAQAAAGAGTVARPIG